MSVAAAPDVNTAAAELLVDGFAAAGVRDFVVCPGSRSTPITLAIARARDRGLVRLHVVVDERAGAFFALGQGRVTGVPSVVVCTSGTAGAHFMPAVIEASLARVPLIVITADRPWELREASAPQTIDQPRLFGTHARFALDLGPPSAEPSALRAFARMAAQTVERALWPDPGATHLNVQFRKPLEPARASGREGYRDPLVELVERLCGRGPTRVIPAQIAPDDGAIEPVASLLVRSSRAIVVCGPAERAGRAAIACRRDAILEFATSHNLPVLAEAASGARFHRRASPSRAISHFDTVLRNTRAREALAPDLVIEFGLPPTSSAYARALGEWTEAKRVVVAPYGWPDPASSADWLIRAGAVEACAALEAAAPGTDVHRKRREPYGAAWSRADAAAERAISTVLETPPERRNSEVEVATSLSEGACVRALCATLPDGAVVMSGNSLAARHLDTFVSAARRDLTVLHQRGACGIDGLVAGGAGAKAASGSPVALLLGDLSLAHDATSLVLAARAGGPFVIVAIDNAGGRIFEGLPIARAIEAGTFEELFAAPAGLDFGALGVAAGVDVVRATSEVELKAALDRGWNTQRTTLVVAVVPPHDHAAREARIDSELARMLMGLGSAIGADLSPGPSPE